MPIKVQEKENSSLKLIPKFEMYMEYMLKIVLIQLPRTEKFSIGTEYKTLMYDTLKNILLVDKIDMSKKLLYLKSYEKLMDAHLKCQNRLFRKNLSHLTVCAQSPSFCTAVWKT